MQEDSLVAAISFDSNRETVKNRVVVLQYHVTEDVSALLLRDPAGGLERFALPGIRGLEQAVAALTTAAEPDGSEGGRSQRKGAGTIFREAGAQLLPVAAHRALRDFRQWIVVPPPPLDRVPWNALPVGQDMLLDVAVDGISLAPSWQVLTLCRDNAERLLADTQTKARFQIANRRYDLLIPGARVRRLAFVGRARFRPESPWQSSLDFPDGRLTVADLSADTHDHGGSDPGAWSGVHLFACLAEASAQTVSAGDGERIGWMPATLARGAASFLGLLRPVRPKFARDLLQTLDAQWRCGVSLAAAVAQTLRRLRRTCANADWTAVVLWGSDR